MNISYKWLKRYINFDLSPKEVAAAFTSLGLECDHVEEVESIKGALKGIVVGKVLTCIPHPNSDHLHITTVDLGDGQPTQIVCGAPNVAAGQTVVVATVGTTLYDGDREFQIKKSKIRGTESFGMICAEDEIGVGKSHDGIMVLPDGVKPGTPAAEYFKLESDYMLEVELTPNRVDAASHYGCARDLKAYFARHNADGEIPQIYTPDSSSFAPDRTDGAAKVQVDDVEGCPRYSGVTIRGVKVQESPEWLKNLLIAAGQRPINNIVDITNFVLLGMGQPLHCFDLDKVSGERIVVRTCPDGTKFTTLDGVEHTLTEADLMICDAKKPLCIAGVFGGLDSGVTEATRNVFIESAYFKPTRVRRTARRQGLSTDASFRYERGTDPNITAYTARLAAVLIKELAGGEICGDVVDIYPDKVKEAHVALDLKYMDTLIGKQLPRDLVRRILTALEIEVLPESTDEVLQLRIPTYRVDVYRPCDVVEEILRVYGYNNVEADAQRPFGHPAPYLAPNSDTNFSYKLKTLVSDQLSGEGFNEIWSNSLTATSYYEENGDWPLDHCVKLMNPLSSDLGVMRQTLLFGGLEAVAHNVNRKAPSLAFYEFGNVHTFDAQKPSTVEKPLAPFSERQMLALWLTGHLQDAATWNTKPAEADFFALRAFVENIFRRLGIARSQLKYVQSNSDTFAARLEIYAKPDRKIGQMGIVRDSLLRRFGIEQPVVYAELEWDDLCKLSRRHKTEFAPLPKTQPVKRDLALLVDNAVTFAQIDECVRKAERKLLQDVTLFDVYEGKNLPQGKKSYAISLTLQDADKTLNDKQIDAIMNKVIASLKRDLAAELR